MQHHAASIELPVQLYLVKKELLKCKNENRYLFEISNAACDVRHCVVNFKSRSPLPWYSSQQPQATGQHSSQSHSNKEQASVLKIKSFALKRADGTNMFVLRTDSLNCLFLFALIRTDYYYFVSCIPIALKRTFFSSNVSCTILFHIPEQFCILYCIKPWKGQFCIYVSCCKRIIVHSS